MYSSITFQLRVAVLLALLSVVRAYSYEEIRRLNAFCFPKDSCLVPRDVDNSKAHNCDCNSLCTLYGSCCIDSPLLTKSRKNERTASCRPAGEKSTKSIYMIDVCASNYKGPAAIRKRCEQKAKNWVDPFSNVPVTNKQSRKTYKSPFCALCNDENAKELTMWSVTLDCSSLTDHTDVCVKNKDFVLNRMMHIREKGQWDLWSRDSKIDSKFRYLPISYKMPAELKSSVKECRPNLISDCMPDWSDSRTERLCKAYMGSVYFGNITFRNAHCALCNGVRNFTSVSCHDTSGSVYKSPTMSFGILLDIDLSDGDKVGNIKKKCDEGQIYDPLSKICRTIECPIPGFVLKAGRCSRE